MTDEQSALRRYSPWKQSVGLRRLNPGKSITDNLLTTRVNPETLDLYSEVHPLPELIDVMRNKPMLVLKSEIPKLHRRKKLAPYGYGITKGLVRMGLQQLYFRRLVSKSKAEDLCCLKEQIREYATRLGYVCGFTKIDRRFIADGKDGKFPYDTAIVLGKEMDRELLDQVPRPGDRLFDFETYIESGKRVFDLAGFIRSKGYRCYARIPFDGFVKYPVHAINAGLGELGSNGVVITREYGPRVRWTMISIEADLGIDSPVDLNMAGYCDTCRLCIRACPGKAIPEERVWWRGVFKRKINDTKCWPYFVKYEGCGICLKVCPIHRFGYEACMKAFQEQGVVLGRGSQA